MKTDFEQLVEHFKEQERKAERRRSLLMGMAITMFALLAAITAGVLFGEALL